MSLMSVCLKVNMCVRLWACAEWMTVFTLTEYVCVCVCVCVYAFVTGCVCLLSMSMCVR